jgi:glucose-6-phosphate 1-dehydrogenase
MAMRRSSREDYVEEAWRIVDPVLAANTPVHEYDAGTWGPPEVHALLPPVEWHNPTVADAVPERIKT